MAKGGDDFDWEQAALDEQATAASVPGHININFNLNMDITPSADGDYSALVDAIKEAFGGMK